MNADDLPFEAFRVAKDAAHKCMVDLDMAAHKPIQGEAMHKVMGWQVLEALYEAGWIKIPDSFLQDEKKHKIQNLWSRPDRRRVFWCGCSCGWADDDCHFESAAALDVAHRHLFDSRNNVTD